VTRRLGLDTHTADFYVARRQLGWLGHVARMDYSRLTRNLLAATSCSSDAIVLGGAPAAARRPAHDVWPLRRQGSRHLRPRSQQVARARRRPPRLAGDAAHSGVRRAVPQPDYRAPSPTPAALPIALTHTGPSDPWRPPTPPSRTPCSNSLRRRGSA
jgi:hypothetical protein